MIFNGTKEQWRLFMAMARLSGAKTAKDLIEFAKMNRNIVF